MGRTQIITEPFDNLDNWITTDGFSISSGRCEATGAGEPQFLTHDITIDQGATYRIDWQLIFISGSGEGKFYVGSAAPTYDFRANGVGSFSQVVVAGSDNTTFRLSVAGPASIIWTMEFINVFRKVKFPLINNTPTNTLINKAI